MRAAKHGISRQTPGALTNRSGNSSRELRPQARFALAVLCGIVRRGVWGTASAGSLPASGTAILA